MFRKYFDNEKEVNFEILKGKILTRMVVDKDYDRIFFFTNNGEVYVLRHEQSCCEIVEIDEIIGELDDLLFSPILLAEKVSENDDEEHYNTFNEEYNPVYVEGMWTFYKLSTIKNSITLRWYGASNGCYAEDAEFYQIFDDNIEE